MSRSDPSQQISAARNETGAWESPLLASVSAPRAQGRKWLMMNLSLGLHAIALAALILAPIYLASGMPDPVDAMRVLVYNPPAAAAPPLPRGELAVRTATPQTAPRADLQPKPASDAPIVPVLVADAAPPEQARATDIAPAGVPDGSDFGVPDGLRGGRDGGVVGGVPDGVVGGVPGGDGDVPVRDVDRGPRLIRQIGPVYPHEAFVKKVSGVVLLEIVIGSDGSVRRATVIDSIPLLDRAAKECVLQWRFDPARKHGRPVASLARTPITFSLY
jgi:protein TonB